MGVIYTPLFTPRASVAPKGAHTRTRRRHRHTQGTPHAHDILRWEVQSRLSEWECGARSQCERTKGCPCCSERRS